MWLKHQEKFHYAIWFLRSVSNSLESRSINLFGVVWSDTWFNLRNKRIFCYVC